MNFIIPFLTLIIIVVFIHEYGHYYFAKKFGVGITDFSIGFGKEIFAWNDKSGTRWKICWIPLGGYVKFFGDRNVFSAPEQQDLINKYSEKDKNKGIIRFRILVYTSIYFKWWRSSLRSSYRRFCFWNNFDIIL